MVCCSLFLGSTKLTSSFCFSLLRGSSCPFLPPSMELWAQLGSLQPGSQLQSAPFLQLHHLQLQSHLCFPAREPPIHSHQPHPWPSSISPCSSATKGISGKETSAPPPQLPDPSARLWLWAGAWARAQAGDRQPVHVALICRVRLLHHLWQTALTHAHIIQTPPIFMWVCETLRERIMLADMSKQVFCLINARQIHTHYVCPGSVFTHVRPSQPRPSVSTLNVFFRVL